MKDVNAVRINNYLRMVDREMLEVLYCISLIFKYVVLSNKTVRYLCNKTVMYLHYFRHLAVIYGVQFYNRYSSRQESVGSSMTKTI